MRKRTKLFRNRVIDKKQLKQIMSWAFHDFGIMKASYLANKLKDRGFKHATQAGLSISIEDLRVPPIKKSLIKLTNKKVSLAEFEVNRGEITEVERFQKVINTWNTTSETLKDQVVNYFRQTDPFNSIYMIAFSGSRGNLSQVRQLVGMRGLMADPNGQIIDLPIITNFREGLTVTDYIISSYGARKGLVDTALRTADSGYLTRRLIDVAQDIITRERNCNTKDGISLTNIMMGSEKLISLEERIVGRLLAISIKSKKGGQIIGNTNEEITPGLAKKIFDSNILEVIVRSPLTCSSSRSVCQQCYGWNLAYGNLIDLGEAVGIIAAQSIGEPGTQLTMRTFHTGGVFTTESSRQVRAQFSGKIVFSKRLKIQSTNTQYGEMAFISENEASLHLITYNNNKLDLAILPETLILIKNNSYVKKNDILFELLQKTKKLGGVKGFKQVYANRSGEIFLENENLQEPDFLKKYKFTNKSKCLLWILFGQVYNIPLKSLIRIKSNSSLRKNQVISEAKLISTKDGFITTFQSKEIEQINHLSISQNSENLKNSNLYFQKNNKTSQNKCVIYGSKNRRIIFNSLSPVNSNEENPPRIGNLVNTKYQTKTGGFFYSSSFKEGDEGVNLSKKKYKVGCTIFYIPESTYKINQNITQLYVKNGDFVETTTEIFKDQFSTISGIVEINENKKIVKEITIKAGQFFYLEKEKTFRPFHQTLVYPGEILLEKIKVRQLSFSEIKTIKGRTFLGVYPIVRFEVVNDLNELNYFGSNILKTKDEVSLGNLGLKFNLGNKIKNNLPLQIVKRPFLIKPIAMSKHFKVKVEVFQKTKKTTHLNFLLVENIQIDHFIPNELKKTDISISVNVKNKQFIEPYTSLTSFQILLLEKNKLTLIKEQKLGKEKKVFLMTKSDYKTLYIEEPFKIFKENKLIRLGEKTKNNFIFNNSGYISKIEGNNLTVHKGQPFLFSKGAVIEKRPGDLIKLGETLGQLVHERARTGDIVQGLPQVEGILEARKPKLEALIANCPGIVVNIEDMLTKLNIWVLSIDFNISQLYTYKISYSQRLLISKFEFINVGQPLNDEAINLHTILDIYFLYYNNLKLLTSYFSAYRSFRKIQAILLNSVQAVYYSQGVNIADKHVEIIIKQMTVKVQIISSGDSPLLPGEIIELRQVFYVNNSLASKEPALFKPILLGITKASLKTNSFISAASFQNTTRVLTEAAIQGKIDWLRGLKENVIVGRLIPAGTGFNAYSDISYIGAKVPSLIKKKEKNLENNLQSSKFKYSKLKDHIKFKFIENS